MGDKIVGVVDVLLHGTIIPHQLLQNIGLCSVVFLELQRICKGSLAIQLSHLCNKDSDLLLQDRLTATGQILSITCIQCETREDSQKPALVLLLRCIGVSIGSRTPGSMRCKVPADVLTTAKLVVAGSRCSHKALVLNCLKLELDRKHMGCFGSVLLGKQGA